MNKFFDIASGIIQGRRLAFDEALGLMNTGDSEVMDLISAAGKIKEHFMGRSVDLCSIINAKSGNCTEDCSFCAQSSHHTTGIERYPLLDRDTIIRRSREVFSSGVKHFGIVIAGKKVLPKDFTTVLETVSAIKVEIGETRTIDTGLGLLTAGQARELADAGCGIYNHNLECSRSFFPAMCTTHTYDERVETIINAGQAGMRT